MQKRPNAYMIMPLEYEEWEFNLNGVGSWQRIVEQLHSTGALFGREPNEDSFG